MRARVAKLLDALRPSDVVSAAAAGADLIVLEEAIHRGIGTHVVLPIARDEFVSRTVIDAGSEWVTLFNSVDAVSRARGCSVTQGDAAPGHEWYLAAHDQLLRRAKEVADGGSIVALTIRPPEGEVPPSVTDNFASRAEQLGLLVLSIDPRPTSTATVIVG